MPRPISSPAIEDVLDGLAVGERHRAARLRRDRSAQARAGPPARTRRIGAPRAEDDESRDRGYYSRTPLLTDSDFSDYDWGGFISLVDELEQRLPFVGVRYLVNKVLAPHNCGISDPHIKRDLINEAVDEGMIEMYTVGNVNERTDPVTACRLDRENPLVSTRPRRGRGRAAEDALQARQACRRPQPPPSSHRPTHPRTLFRVGPDGPVGGSRGRPSMRRLAGPGIGAARTDDPGMIVSTRGHGPRRPLVRRALRLTEPLAFGHELRSGCYAGPPGRACPRVPRR